MSDISRRKFVASGAAMMAVAAGRASAWPGNEGRMRDDEQTVSVRRLTWAGVRFECGGTAIFVDPITTDIWEGKREFPIVDPVPGERRSSVLITHLHNDHYDPKAVGEIIGDRGRVVCHRGISTEISSEGFRVRDVEMHEPYRFAEFTITAVPAVDGLGVIGGQVSWVIRAGGKTFIHGGDTLWHGHWWTIGRAYGPFDAAYLPINGAHLPGFTPQSLTPASMTPEQAVAACAVMDARLLTPIHFGHHDPDNYQETPDAVPRLLAASAERSVPVEYLEVGGEAAFVANR